MKITKRSIQNFCVAVPLAAVMAASSTSASFALPSEESMKYERRQVETVLSSNEDQRATFVTAMTKAVEPGSTRIKVYAGVEDLQYYDWLKWWDNHEPVVVDASVELRRNGEREGAPLPLHWEGDGVKQEFGGSVEFPTDNLSGVWRAEITISVKGMAYGKTDGQSGSNLYPSSWQHKIIIAYQS